MDEMALTIGPNMDLPATVIPRVIENDDENQRFIAEVERRVRQKSGG